LAFGKLVAILALIIIMDNLSIRIQSIDGISVFKITLNKKVRSWVQWFTLIIPATWEVESRKMPAC
jgi:hypothetical protein